MNTPLFIGFENFKKLADNHRVYYYESDIFVDFHFLTEGIIVKTRLMRADIENPKQFFSDKLFYGAMPLSFNIPVPLYNKVTDLEVKEMPMDLSITDIQDDEVKNIDIQIEGVDYE